MKDLEYLLEQLNTTDECHEIEAKRADKIGKAVLESICAFSNEPDMGGGYILLGVVREKEENTLFPQYIVSGIPQEFLDQYQSDIASQCASAFNLPIRPLIRIESINKKNVIILKIDELSKEQKPLYFKSRGLPQGAFRRVGSSDMKCTEEDLIIFYQDQETFDSSIMKRAEYEDLSKESIHLYRTLRKEVNASAVELEYGDHNMLVAIGALVKAGTKYQVTYAGLLCFGKRIAFRRLLPMTRVDYIRVSSNEWIEDGDRRFEYSLDMRGSILQLVHRIINTINDDLPKGFELTEEQIQAKSIGLPQRVLREAIVNALIHRSYRIPSPIQIIRYPNRIEIINPGFSLKNEEHLGEPGSITRNPSIAAIFHETNLAETKGSGIRTMQRLMESASMLPPTFESNRKENKFTTRLLLHHFLNEEDIGWLGHFEDKALNDNQKRILIFVREVGAIDNSSARQINGTDSSATYSDLKSLIDNDLLIIKSKSRFSYYLPSIYLLNTYANQSESETLENNNKSKKILPTNQGSLPTNLDLLPTNLKPLSTNPEVLSDNMDWLPDHITGLTEEEEKAVLEMKLQIDHLPKRVNNKNQLFQIILKLCAIHPFSTSDLAGLLDKNDKYLYESYIKPLLKNKKIEYLYPDMVNHPDQAYITKDPNPNI